MRNSGVYIYKHPDTKKLIYKIGKSNDVISRHKNLSTAYFTPISETVYIYPVIDKIYTSGYLIFLEKQMHNYFKKKRINPNREFFKIQELMPKLEKFKIYMENMGILINITINLNDLKNVYDIILDKYADEVGNSEIANDEDNEIANNENVEANEIVSVETINTITEPTYYEPYNYQVEIIECMYNVLSEKKRGILELATGIGKTCLVGFYLKKYNMNSVLVLCPQILICESFKNTLSKCGVKSIIINSENQGEFVNNVITITTYQTYLLNIDVINGLNYDLIIYDEAHHLLAESFRKSLDAISDKKLFMTATKKSYKKLEELVDLESERESEEENVESESDSESDESESEVSMDVAEQNNSNKMKINEQFDMNDPIFGETIYKITIEEGILKGLLCDYKIFLGNWELGLYNLVMQLKENYLRKKIIMYFNTIKNSKEICEELKEDFNAYHIDGSMSRREKQEILENFKKDEFSILCNVNVIAEGVDIPAIDTIIFMESRYSEINVVQIIGRSVRVCQNKDFSMVICKPDMFNAGEFIVNLSKQDSRISSKNMFLKPIDSLKYELDNVVKLVEVSKFECKFDWWVEKCLEFEKNNNLTESSIYESIKISSWLTKRKQDYKKNKLTNEQKEKLLKINYFKKWIEFGGDKIKAKKNPGFDEMINLCIEYEKENELTYSSIYKNIKIGVWIDSRRQDYKKNKLTEDKIEKMLQIKCFKKWIDEGQDKIKAKKNPEFDEMLNLCIEFEKENKMIDSSIYKNIKIGKWISHQRQKFKKSKLLKEEINKLLQIKNFKNWIDSEQDKIKTKKNPGFDEMINLCIEYEKENKITQTSIYKDIKIGNWIGNIKQDYKNNKLSKDQILQILRINYFKKWVDEEKDKIKAIKNPEFDEMVKLCIEYEKDNKFNSDIVYKNIRIGGWITNQRYKYKINKLTKEKIEKLLQIKYFKEWVNNGKDKIIDNKTLDFDEMLNLCIEYEKENEITQKSINKNKKIGSWISRQKQDYKKNKLIKEEINKLLQIKCFKKWCENGGDKIIAKKNPNFDEMINLCIEYEKKNELTYSSIYKDIKIGRWISKTKQKFKHNKLTEDQLSQLNQINYWKEWLETLT